MRLQPFVLVESLFTLSLVLFSHNAGQTLQLSSSPLAVVFARKQPKMGPESLCLRAPVCRSSMQIIFGFDRRLLPRQSLSSIAARLNSRRLLTTTSFD